MAGEDKPTVALLYQLVRDQGADIKSDVKDVAGKMDTLNDRFEEHLRLHATKQGQAQGVEDGRNQVLGIGAKAVGAIVFATSVLASIISVAGDAILSAITGHHT